jgi:hypothetical protein
MTAPDVASRPKRPDILKSEEESDASKLFAEKADCTCSIDAILPLEHRQTSFACKCNEHAFAATTATGGG